MSEIISKSNITIDGVITANSLITSGGTSSQFVKGDGTLDPSTYLLNITGESLSSLSDVTITTIAAGELLKWDGLGWINNTLAEAGIMSSAQQLAVTKAAVTNQFLTSYNATTGLFTSKQVAYSGLSGIPSTFTPSPHTLDSHSNVTITSNTSGELLKWNGSAWINNTLAEAGISAVGHTHVISDITDFTDNSSNWDTAYGWGNHAAEPYRQYRSRTITGVSFDPVDTYQYYEIGRFVFGSLQGVITFDLLFSGSGLGAAYRYSVPVTYAMDYVIRYGITAIPSNTWVVWTPDFDTPRHYVSNSDDVQLQLRVIGNTVEFRVVVTTPSGTSGSTGTIFANITHSNEFVGGTYTELTGTGTDATAYTVIPSLASPSYGVSRFSGEIYSRGNIISAGTVTATGGNSTQWNTAYGWGNHASAGYLTSETNTFLGDGGSATTHPGTSRVIFTGQVSAGSAAQGMPTIDNSNAILNINRHPGEYNSQLGFSSNGSMYYRSFSATAINSTQAWRQVWDSGNLTNNSTNWNTAFGWGDHAGLYAPISHSLDSHNNVTITSNTSGELLKWNGSAWINNTLAEAGIMSSTKQLAVTKALITNQVLNSYNATTGVFTSIQPTFASLASKPTTIAGYGITDFNSLGDARWLGISATAANSTLFNSLNSGQFLRSDVADTKTSGDLTFNDSIKLQLGTDNDFKMFHDGADARAQWITGDLVFQDNLTTRFTFERTTGNFTNKGTITSQGVGDSTFRGSLLVGTGEPSPACAFHVVDEVNLLGGVTGDSQEFRRLQYRGGSGGNDIKISEYALRDATGTSWTTSRYHNSIGIDNVFKTPGVDTKVFWERDPHSGFHYFGNAANYVLTVDGVGNNVGIGTTSPSYRLDVTGDGRFTSSLAANSFIKRGGTASQFLKADGSVDTNTYVISLPSTSFATLSLNMTDISSGLIEYKKINGRLILSGGFTVTSTGLINVGTLPVGFRPSRFRTLVVINGGSAGQLSIQTDGSITADIDSITEYNIDIEITLDIED